MEVGLQRSGLSWAELLRSPIGYLHFTVGFAPFWVGLECGSGGCSFGTIFGESGRQEGQQSVRTCLCSPASLRQLGLRFRAPSGGASCARFWVPVADEDHRISEFDVQSTPVRAREGKLL